MNAAHSERRTLPKIAVHAYDGFEDFYVGDIARRIHADMKRNGGYITPTHAAGKGEKERKAKRGQAKRGQPQL